jgi:hypothetical protein
MNKLAVSVVLALAASASFAEDDKSGPAQPPVEPKKDEAPAAPSAPPAPPAPPAAPEEPIVPVRGTRYKVTMKTGRTLFGVVVAEKVFERREGLIWNTAEKAAPGAGVRLFFVKDQEGFVFVTSRDLRNAERIGDVTIEEGKVLAQQHIVGARRADEERDRIRKDRAAKEEAAKAKAAAEADQSKATADGAKTPTPAAPGAAAAPAAPSAEDQIARYTALLMKFPPGRYTPDTPKDIEKRRVVMDLFPTDEEKQFLAVFAEWSKAYAAWKAGQDKPAAAASEATK